jgi:hypothetical protein
MEKVDLITKRANFFNQIVEMLERKPDEIDKLMKQDVFYIAPSKKIINPEKGELLLGFPVDFYGKKFNVWYSFWQYSFDFKIGIFVEDPKLENAFMTDTHREIKFLWGSDLPPRFDNSRGTVMYEWEFRVPRLFDSYIYQEKYVLGSRHMHFRLMRVLHDECLILDKKVNPMSGLTIL